MNRKYLRRFENLIMITFPVVLFAGCAGSDIKPLVEEKPAASYSVYTNPMPSKKNPQPAIPFIRIQCQN